MLWHLELCHVQPFVEQGLCQRVDDRQKKFSGIDNHASCRVGPASCTAQGDGGVESRTGGIDAVESGCQREFGTFHIGTAGKQLQRYAHRKFLRELLPRQPATLNGARNIAQQNGETVTAQGDGGVESRTGGISLTCCRRSSSEAST